MHREIILKVNGKTHAVHAEPDTPLIYVLRNDLGLKGSKLGCGLNQCGSCRILLEGQATPSCRLPLKSVEGREVTTIEGLGSADDLHPIQKAFIEEQAVQCGFCTPGMIMAAKALLDRIPNPTEAEIRAGMSGNLCRCGTHDRVLRAIRRAAGQPVPSRFDENEFPEHRTTASRTAPGTIELPAVLQENPELDAWIRVETDGVITIFTGKVELGQDIRTSLAMIGADELDVPLDRIRVVMGDTDWTPAEGYTTSSLSLETSGNALRCAAAEVRRVALTTAGARLEAPVKRLTVVDGTICDPATGHSTTYRELFGGRKFNRRITGTVRPKQAEAYKIVGRATKRLDLISKVTGSAFFVHDLELPYMVHGRVVRPPNYAARLISVDDSAVAQMPGVVKIVRDGSFLGVIAEREEQAVWAMEALRKKAAWKTAPLLSDQEALFDEMLSRPSQEILISEGIPVDDPVPPIEAPAGAARTLSATYFRPYHSHASLGPSAATAHWVDNKLTVWTHNQGSHPLRKALSMVLKKSEEDIRIIHVDGPGCFGHNGADDAALDAALLARALPGRPVSLKWMRADENAWEPYGSAAVVKMQASLDSGGNIIDWNHDVWGFTHSTRPHDYGGACGLMPSWHLAEPFEPPQPGPNRLAKGGVHRNADPLYTFPRRRIVKHFLRNSPLRTSALRGLGSYANIFSLESFLDEVAYAAGADPAAFRLRYLADDRARAVIRAAVGKAGSRTPGLGRGMAFARYKNVQSYVAVVMDLTVDEEKGDIQLVRAVMAADVGQIVNPDALKSQLEGSLIQSASWTLKEQVSFDRNGITSLDWRRYPILRFVDIPAIETVLLDRPDQPYLGFGEGAQGPVAAAIANAVFDAAGIRLRRIPFTSERVKTALR
jgi:nicotinate dehydrogenase subunit B